MQILSKAFLSAVAAALFVSVSVTSASACSEGYGKTVWVPGSQSVADSSTPLPPVTKPGTDG
jgi:cytosine/uracil/thiamine/allantoin permease